MKILTIHWGSNGGGPKYALDMAQALSKTPDVELHVSYSEYADNAQEWWTLSRLRHSVLTYRSNIDFLMGAPRLLKNIITLRKYIKVNNIMTVYSPMLSIWQSLSLPLWLPRDVYYISTIHDAQSHPGDSKFLARRCQARELRRADRIVVLSEHVRMELLEKNASHNISVVPMGVDAAVGSNRTLPFGTIYIGFFGRILAYKGIELFADAISELSDRGHDIKGLVYGAGTVSDNVRQRGGKNVEWNIRWIEKSEIESIFESFDLVLLPYIEASQSGVISIACRYGVPQVVTPIGGLSEQIEQTRSGIVAKLLNATSLADSIEDVISNRELYEELSLRSCAAGQGEYSWQRAAEKLVEIVSAPSDRT
ncbi:glycosyltransferase family 4 protein [Arthrobacter sp. H35-D1]|uniref:glycosyltransferase family 4 protein n=1 Tax=Arthrobacter sp. H35-D1 TaxID=3046202 RepID=UPI0024BA5DF8|nr:glycosyltransferase family 4 protein [Arthrobacter sp. H35-D1]MDJ0315358.1 glycosyltransferase family 4 protein [Arthrobacter sp. H35-D1]